MERLDIYQTVTDTIIEAIEKGLTEQASELPWHGTSALPQNAHTGNSYRGVNIPVLWSYKIVRGYGSGIWATYRQWKELGAQVTKGAKGVQIARWVSIEVQATESNQEQETLMFPRYFTVFNADQVDGYEPPALEFEPSDIQAIAQADTLIDSCGVQIRHDENEAFYNKAEDFINLPSPEYFKDTNGSSATENYYGVAFHELTHWSGAPHRLDRDHSGKYGSSDYAFEELIAELGAAMCCASTGVEAVVREDHAHYVQSWLTALKGDKKFIFAASSQAQKAVDYLYSFQSRS
jgi:antirestriction protein ArdC